MSFLLQRRMFGVGPSHVRRGEVSVYHELEFFRRIPEEFANLFNGKWPRLFMLDQRRIKVLHYHHARNQRRLSELQAHALAAEPAANRKPTPKSELFAGVNFEVAGAI